MSYIIILLQNKYCKYILLYFYFSRILHEGCLLVMEYFYIAVFYLSEEYKYFFHHCPTLLKNIQTVPLV